MGKYDAQAATALRLISKKGGNITLTRYGAASFDPVTQLEVQSQTAYTAKGVCLPPGKSAEFRLGSLEGRNLVECHFAASGLAVTPAPGDEFTYQGAKWKIVWAETLDPAGDGAIFTKAYAER